jgi:hypothetical protein
MFDKIKGMKDKADDLADTAKGMAEKVPGGEGIADKIDEVSDQVDGLTDKIPGMDDGEAAAE